MFTRIFFLALLCIPVHAPHAAATSANPFASHITPQHFPQTQHLHAHTSLSDSLLTYQPVTSPKLVQCCPTSATGEILKTFVFIPEAMVFFIGSFEFTAYSLRAITNPSFAIGAWNLGRRFRLTVFP